jgi:glucose uptake protein
MVLVESYPIAVLMCIITMICWGSWANTQKLASKEWRFQLFYWDYCLGILLLTLLFAFTLGNTGEHGRSFVDDLRQAHGKYIGYAILGGVVFNIANILLVAAIDIAGMAVAFPIGIGLALVIGVIMTYRVDPSGNPVLLFAGVACVTAAIILDALAYRRIPSSGQKTTVKGIVLSILCGVLMGQFFQFVATAMPQPLSRIADPEMAGKLTPYTALVFFAVGLFLSSFVFNSLVMLKPFVGEPVPFGDYFTKGNLRLHAVGIAGGMIWGVGMSFAILAGDTAGYAISYGLGQGATMVAALWGVFVWKEFQNAQAGTSRLLALMFALFVVGLALIVYANVK